MKIETKDKQGRPNGWIQTIWRADASGFRPEQVYLTVVLPGTRKGPHLHKKRTGRFVCIAGRADIVIRTLFNGCYLKAKIAESCIVVSPGEACEIVCVGDEPAYVLNFCSPAYSASDPDEWDVPDWNPPEAIAL